MYEDFLSYLSSSRQVIFIEAEAIEEKMNDFIRKYNDRYNKQIGLNSEGVCLLGDVNKWGVELRIYFNNISNIPDCWDKRKYANKKYRANEFSYRIDDNALVWFLFDNGYCIGYN